MPPFEYHHASLDEVEQLGSAFCDQHGDDPRGLISEAEFDRLYDHLVEILSRRGTFAEGGGPGDFSSSRYVDPIPWITVVPHGAVTPALALATALEAVSTAHRPLAVRFDYYPETLLVLPPNRVFTTFERAALAEV